MSKYFDFPVTAENLKEFCYPEEGHHYAEPFKWDEDVGVSNGWVAMRVTSFVDCDNECPEAVERLEKQHWGFHDMNLTENAWGRLDTRLGGLWRNGATKMWGKSPSGKVYARTTRRIGVGSVTVVSHAVLQLISKLPRAEVYTEGRFNDPLYFRFNGGIGIATSLQHERKEALVRYRIFKKSDDLF